MIRNGATTTTTQIMGRLVRRRLPTSTSTSTIRNTITTNTLSNTIMSSSSSSISGIGIRGLRWKSSNLHKRAVTALNKNAKVMTLKKNTNTNKSTNKTEPTQATATATATASTIASTSPTKPKEANAPPTPPPSTPQINGAASSSTLPPLPFHQGHLMEFAPRIVVVGVGGGGGNAVNNMIANDLQGVDFLALNTDAQHLSTTLTDNRIQIGTALTSGLGCGANPDAGRLAAEESKSYIEDAISDAHMVFITAGMGGGTGTGAAPVVAELCYNMGILTVGVVTKPFRFEGTHRMRLAKEGVDRLSSVVDTLIVIPNQNLFALANDSTSFMDSFQMADNVLLAGVKSITDLMTAPGLINLDFADVQSVMHGMGNAMLGTGLASHEDANGNVGGGAGGAGGSGANSKGGGNGTVERAVMAAEMALSNPLVGENMDVATAKGMLVNITGGKDMTLFEVDRAAQCITERIIDENANIIFGSAYDESLDGSIRVSVVATGIEEVKGIQPITSTIIQ